MLLLTSLEIWGNFFTQTIIIFMNGNEKKDNELKLRFTDTELKTLTRLSILEDRTVTDMAHSLIKSAIFGVAYRLDEITDRSN